MNEVLYLIIFILNIIITVSGDEVLGCGGFIKSHVPIDFSKVEVRLVTKQGIVKDKTSAAPNNGYYFVPLYDKGELLLELSPPPGWSFEPKQVTILVDGVSDLCSKGQDINFVFQGFGITGKVESLYNNVGGPEGVTVQLISKGEVRSTTTDNNGNFFFTPVFPGAYTVSILHPRWKIYKESIEVQVAESNAELPKNSLVVQGYDVRGKVRSDGEPMRGVTVILFSKEEKKPVFVEGCNTNSLTVQFKNKILCHVMSNDAGEFVFGTVPSGDYYIVPYYQGQNVYFQPEQIDFTINHNSLELKENFEIVGFNIPGKVVKSKNVAVANAKIFLNGQELMQTDSNGRYKLEKIKAGTYKLRAEADDLIFEEILVRVNPNLQELPDILPSAFKVCGQVASDHSQIVTFSKVGSTKFVQTETSPQDGSFCQYLSPGQYSVQVLVSDEDKQKGLQFFPITQVVEVTSDKILNVMFSQLKSTISGKVQCIRSKDCESLSVILKTGNEKEITLKVKDGSYSIGDMYPGTYDIVLVPNKLCWKTSKQTINVNSAVIEVPPFVQRGYTVSFVSSHDTQVVFKIPGQITTTKFNVSKGRSSYCLEKPGEYLFTLEGCHVYNPSTVSYNTDAEVNEILLTAQKHTLTLGIQAESDFGNIQVFVKIGTDKVERILKYNNGLYELHILLEPDENAVITPQSETIFFSPPILSVDGREDCENVGVKFVAVRGKLFKGKVVPPLAGVTITVESMDGESLIAETNDNGLFSFPPLDNKKEYTISASKESYVLSGPNSEGNFLAHKLAEVIVEVLDAVDNSPLPGVLLSLSGGESYRRNLQSDENGKISFHSLSPSEYFLRPMMKEYQFEPSSKIIPVNEGQTVHVKLIGKRVAYSAFGHVVSLNGEPEDNMIIIASGIGNCSHFSEETSCESSGKFRIRGLQPYCSYRVVVKGSADDRYQVERTTPEFIEIENIAQDVKELKLIVFRPVSQMDILVKVYAENVDHYKSLKVKLTRELGSSVIVYTSKIDTSIKLTNDINPGVLLHIPSIPIDSRPYAIQLETNLAQTTKWKPQIHHFNANTSFKFIELDFNVKSSNSEQPMKQTSIWSLIFILSIVCVLYNIDLVANILKDKFDFNISAVTNLIPIPSTSQKNTTDYYDNAQIDQIVQSINAVKKKPKPKKA
ncbi:hypothetical protein NQ315_010051 [Exocentrus adspersus]|uniref:Nodal modulator 1 n=1 Tax=Exocentrus adspersus TaxID=1586481 RepID=A0AAV8WA89_9CUCU|nr:hypothetical protein NQ315_010051 [Exocentrus adspersus]